MTEAQYWAIISGCIVLSDRRTNASVVSVISNIIAAAIAAVIVVVVVVYDGLSLLLSCLFRYLVLDNKLVTDPLRPGFSSPMSRLDGVMAIWVRCASAIPSTVTFTNHL